jgi:hypothetical protein
MKVRLRRGFFARRGSGVPHPPTPIVKVVESPAAVMIVTGPNVRKILEAPAGARDE